MVTVYLLFRVDEKLTVKVADFGLARDVFEKDYYRSEARRPLPYKWMAPECIDFQKFDSRSDVVRFRNKTRTSFM